MEAACDSSSATFLRARSHCTSASNAGAPIAGRIASGKLSATRLVFALVARDEDGAAFVALRHQREEDLDLVSALLDVANVVEDQQLEGVEPSERTGQVEVSLGREQFLDQAEGWREEDGVPAARQGVAECGGGVRLPPAGQAEAEDVVRLVEERARGELVELREDGAGNPGAVERFRASCRAAGAKP